MGGGAVACFPLKADAGRAAMSTLLCESFACHKWNGFSLQKLAALPFDSTCRQLAARGELWYNSVIAGYQPGSRKLSPPSRTEIRGRGLFRCIGRRNVTTGSDSAC
jgi:hypothetical protein